MVATNPQGREGRHVTLAPQAVARDEEKKDDGESAFSAITVKRYRTEEIPRNLCTPGCEEDVSPTRLSRFAILEESNIRRAATDGAVQLEATRLRVEESLLTHDHFFRGHDEPLLLGCDNATEHIRSCKYWYLYVRRLILTYFIPLQLGVVTGLLWANIDNENYVYLWGTDHHKTLNFGFTIAGHDVTLHFICNDIFMCFFFGIAMVEIMVAVLPGGALSPFKKAVSPLLGTIGGIVGPIVVFFLLLSVQNALGAFDDSPHSFSDLAEGWGICVATDISLAWLFASFVFGGGHSAIKFLLLLAVADDIGGVLIIAFFYPSDVPAEYIYLLMVAGGVAVAMGLRYMKCKWWTAYVFIAGPLIWYGMIKSSVHAALALCPVIPFMHQYIEVPIAEEATVDGSTGSGDFSRVKHGTVMIRDDKRVILGPLLTFDHDMAFFVHCGLFFFALANAGVLLTAEAVGWITFNITVSLVVGKTLGIFSFTWFAVKVLKCPLPDGMTLRHLFVVGIISGAGLTVALFVAESAYSQEDLLAQAKLGALLSIVVAPIAIVMGRIFKIKKIKGSAH